MKFFSRDKPKIKVESAKKDGFSGWLKCTSCNEMIHMEELQKNHNCCPKCDYHYRITAEERIQLLTDANSFIEEFSQLTSSDPLSFVDSEPYKERLEKANKKAGANDAIITGTATINTHPLALAVFNFNYMGGSMGSVVGEKLTRLIELATKKRYPLLIVSTSGGARMQESTLSLMQMAKTSAALAKFSEAGLPYISLLTNPTSGGVTASFASLGDIILAEPKALICFAGPRVIEQTIRHKLPAGAQQSEFLLHHGMIDAIVNRRELKNQIGEFITYLTQDPLCQ